MSEDLTPGGNGSLHLSDGEFSQTMAGLGPFETAPSLAIAVSGGADSLALCLLAHRWAQARGGHVTALTVNHGLRREAAEEAAQVGRWLAPWGIAHHCLTVSEQPPTADIQHWARRHRYALLRRWCADAGVLHLLLAHHQDDQAETFLLRLARGSGVNGLSSMAPITLLPECRLLRPLLSVPKARLTTTLRALGQPWAEDPSNHSPRYARVQMRDLLPQIAPLGLTVRRLAATAATLAGPRAMIDDMAAALLAATVSIPPTGTARIDTPHVWKTQPRDVAAKALSSVLACLGGQLYPPRADRLDQALARWGQDLTVGGCRLVMERQVLWVWREARSLPTVTIHPGEDMVWDRRFHVRWPQSSRGASVVLGGGAALTLRPLGSEGVAVLRGNGVIPDRGSDRDLPVPRRALTVFPSVWSDRILVSVPHLGYSMTQAIAGGDEAGWPEIRFMPEAPLCTAGLLRPSGCVP